MSDKVSARELTQERIQDVNNPARYRDAGIGKGHLPLE